MGTHPIRRPSDIRPIYTGAASRPDPSVTAHKGWLTRRGFGLSKQDAEGLAEAFGFDGAEEFAEFALEQQAKANARECGDLDG